MGKKRCMPSSPGGTSLCLRTRQVRYFRNTSLAMTKSCQHSSAEPLHTRASHPAYCEGGGGLRPASAPEAFEEGEEGVGRCSRGRRGR